MSGYTFTVFKGSPTGIQETTTHRPTVKADEVFLKVTHSGVCGTDEHFKGVEMGLGHEGIGIVEEAGEESGFKKGDRAGWGYNHQTCGECEYCTSGDWNYCTDATGKKQLYGFANHDQGSFATGAVWKRQALFAIPEGLDSAAAAPLMCAGITVWAPFSVNGIRATDVVGVVGIGGLGHLAIQFANKWGCEVVALSSTEDKKEEALKLGAHHFVATKGAKSLSVPRKITHLIVTTSRMPDWDLYSAILAPRAVIFPMTITDMNTKLEVPFMNFLLSGWSFVGSTVPARIEYIKMLRFAALHGVKPVVEKFPLSKQGVEESLKKLDEGKVRYRGVLVAEGH